MIKANELRIGNWVSTPENGFVQVEYFTGETLKAINYSGPDPIGIFSPIPLTEKWLEDLGFYKIENNLLGVITNLYVLKVLASDLYFEITEDLSVFEIGDHQTWRVKIKYVHQLQNLFFSLTGEELTLK